MIYNNQSTFNSTEKTKNGSTFVIQQAPADPLFGLMAKCKADSFKTKVDLGVGAYRDNSGKPWVLPVVKKVA